MPWGLINLIKAKWTASGKQPILKGDFLDIETAILQAHQVIQVPNILWTDATAIKVPATADSPAALLMSGFPNILHPGAFVSGGLTNGKYRANVADAPMDFDIGTALWGTEKASQWYIIYALAGNADTVFTLKAMPFMRFSSQASQVITLRNNLNTANIGYGFTTDELVGGKIYVLNGASAGLLRAITANNNDNGTGGTVTYSGDALSMSQGDWFVVLPPGTNFRLVGSVFNNDSSNIVKFRRRGARVQWLAALFAGGNGDPKEDIRLCCPLATEAMAYLRSVPSAGNLEIGFPGSSAGGFSRTEILEVAPGGYVDAYGATLNFGVEFCKYYVSNMNYPPVPLAYSYPAGCGY